MIYPVWRTGFAFARRYFCILSTPSWHSCLFHVGEGVKEERYREEVAAPVFGVFDLFFIWFRLFLYPTHPFAKSVGSPSPFLDV